MCVKYPQKSNDLNTQYASICRLSQDYAKSVNNSVHAVLRFVMDGFKWQCPRTSQIVV